MDTVLIVDDDSSLRLLLKLLLGGSGRFHVAGEARNGREAIELAGKLKPHIVLLDLVMPVMTGYEALPRLREASPASKVVVLTMLQKVDAEPESLRLGAYAFLDKGLPDAEFIDQLSLIASGSRAARPGASPGPRAAAS